MRYRFIRFPGGKIKAVTFSYDDASRDDIRLVETLNRYGIKCTFNINSGWLDKERSLTTKEVKQYILGYGHEVAVHGEYHKAPGKIRAIDGIKDILNCRINLEKKFGRIIRGMAYPDSGIRYFNNTATYDNIRQYLKDLDIAYARTLGSDNNSFALPTDWYAWMPTAHHTNPNVLQYAKEFVEMDVESAYIAARTEKLFYLWGHSAEFERQQKWDLLEEICQCLGGRDDIWYATNMEIYKYVEAYHSLIFSAEGDRVYNPTLFHIWFDVDGKLYEIQPGQEILL